MSALATPEAAQRSFAELLPCIDIAECAGAKVKLGLLDGCAEDDVPILRLLRRPCPSGTHGFGCDIRWDLHDNFLPKPKRWLRQWNASKAAAVDCQGGFFAAFADVLTRAHWEQEWDAQPFRIGATPPRTMGKMLHQLVTANYFHLTAGTNRRNLRLGGVPGAGIRKLPQPGFRWNVLDYGGGGREEIDYKRLTTMPGNVFSRPLAAGSRCAGVRAAWHCLWQRFPSQSVPPAPASRSPVGLAAEGLYNLSLSGRRPDGLVQYLVAAGVVSVFTQPTTMTRAYLRDHLRAICHRGGPHCGGSADEKATPVAAVHVRLGDSCDRRSSTPGPWNAMFAEDPKSGKLERTTFRYCYAWPVYRAALAELQQAYGVRTVLLATDDHTGTVVRAMREEKSFNWLYLDYPREQFRKRAWMEFRSDLDENAPCAHPPPRAPRYRHVTAT